MKIVLELTAGEYRALAGHLITAEGYAQKRERECRRLMRSMLTLEEKNEARQMARRAREDYKGAMALRNKLYRAAARAEGEEAGGA